MISDSEVAGYVFKPSLQDISMKRFRLRYSPLNDCYYLHWDNTVCPQLSRIEGLENGVASISSVHREEDNETGKVFLTSRNHNADSNSYSLSLVGGKIQWSIDFSECGLAVMSASIRAVGPEAKEEDEEEDSVRVCVTGHESETYCIDNGDYTEVKGLYGSRKLTLTAYLPPGHSRFLSCDLHNPADCPLDIKLNLMCYRPEKWSYNGELLLGLKYNPTGAAESLRTKEDITVECGLMGGQLQAHVVEGAGLVKGTSRKPFNAFVRCQFLPDPSNLMTKQTVAKHSVYPTWAKEFIFAGVDKSDLLDGGLEVTVCDHHTFLNDTIMGGVRLCVPQKSDSPNNSLYNGRSSPLLISPCSSRSASPDLVLPLSHTTYCYSPSPSPSPSPCPSPVPSPSVSCSDLTDIGTSDYRITFPEAHLQIPTDNLSSLRDKLKSKSLPRPLSCHLDSPSGVRKVPIFTIPRGGTSPMSSPILSRRKKRFSCASPRISPKPLKKELHNKENLLHAWMDGKGNEVTHWQAVMDNPGEWVYCWHLLRHNLTPAHQ